MLNHVESNADVRVGWTYWAADHAYKDCDDILGSSSLSLSRMVIADDKLAPGQDGWVQYSDGDKVWIDPACRSQLEADGLPVEILPWPQIASFSDKPYRRCDEL
jgi:hypothetical protein